MECWFLISMELFGYNKMERVSGLSFPNTNGLTQLCYSQCAGNRRTAMSKTRPVKGVGWDVAAIGNGKFWS